MIELKTYRYKLMQITGDGEKSRTALFMDYDWVQKHGGIDPSVYKEVWSGAVDAGSDVIDVLEYLYGIFNGDDRPNAKTSRSLSTSDIVILESDNAPVTTWYCNSFGWKKVEVHF